MHLSAYSVRPGRGLARGSEHSDTDATISRRLPLQTAPKHLTSYAPRQSQSITCHHQSHMSNMLTQAQTRLHMPSHHALALTKYDLVFDPE